MSEKLIPAAQYVRMSTENQKYSTANQAAAIAEYARDHGYEIVATFSDPGISGLDLKHRPGLKAMLEAVVKGGQPFETILVLDVSRWGRFQDIDESAYYEFLCRKSGIQIQYCGEPFTNDRTAYSNLVKSIKRTMAAEYSRELGVKVLRGQSRLAGLGFKQGGSPAIGLRRVLIDQDGHPKQPLAKGERKCIMTDRVILVPGPAGEQRFVRSIFTSFLQGRSIYSIARELRKYRRYGRRWTGNSVWKLLQNQQYVGTYVYNRTSTTLKTKLIAKSPDQWICKPGALQPIVSADVFAAAQQRFLNFTVRLTDDEMLRRLRRLFEKEGYLSSRLINASRDVPSLTSYRTRFGTMSAVLRLIGCSPIDRGGTVSRKRMLAVLRKESWTALKANLQENGLHLRTASLYPYKIHVSGVPVFNFVLAHPLPNAREKNGPAWQVRPPQPMPIHRSVVAMLSFDRKRILEYLICPALRKTPARAVEINLPLLARISLARFSSPAGFFNALKGIGYVGS